MAAPARGPVPCTMFSTPAGSPASMQSSESRYAVIGVIAGEFILSGGGLGYRIAYAYETGRMVAGCVDRALTSGDGLALQEYPDLLAETYGLYYKVARLFVKAIGNPAVMRELTRVGMQSRTLMEWVLRIMANLLRPDEIGPAEAEYKAAAALVRLAPRA